MPESVAVKFDLFSNAGEGPDSTGLYTNGATPTAPAIDLSSTGVNLHSGDTFNAQLAYNGTVLTVVITDKVTNASATQVYTSISPQSSARRHTSDLRAVTADRTSYGGS